MVRRTVNNTSEKTTLNGGITAAALTITVLDGSTFPTANFLVRINDAGDTESTMELVDIESRTGHVLTVRSGGRGFGGTTAAIHADNDDVRVVVSAEYYTDYLGGNPLATPNPGASEDGKHVFWDDTAKNYGLEAPPAGGGGGGNFEYVGHAVAAGGSTTVLEVVGISATDGEDLYFFVQAETDRASANGDNLTITLRENATWDTGASSYSWARERFGTSTGTAVDVSDSGFQATGTGAAGADATAASADAGEWGYMEGKIIDYTAAQGENRRLHATSSRIATVSNIMHGKLFGTWKNTADAIDGIRVEPLQGTNFIDGSRLIVYRTTSA